MDSEKREKIEEMAVWLASVHWSRSGAGCAAHEHSHTVSCPVDAGFEFGFDVCGG